LSKFKKIKSIIPNRFKQAVKDFMGMTALSEQMTMLESQQKIFKEILFGEDIWERSRKRWRNSEPGKDLTWGREIIGDNFIKTLKKYVVFDNKTQILEIGPGYGRLLKSFKGMKLGFKKYVGLDISEKNAAFLRANFKDKAIEFVHGDVESFTFNEKFDVIFSSLTFKHLFPTFENALKNLARCMKKGGIILFDLIEGDVRHFENDLVTYLHGYSKEQVIEILKKIPLELVAFDQVEHEPDFVRLLVVAKKN
jgi:SAM-dependent methyltransferase